MHYHSISHKHKSYTKSHLELQREIALIELAKFDEIPALTLQDIKETKRCNRQTDARMNFVNSKPTDKHSLQGV